MTNFLLIIVLFFTTCASSEETKTIDQALSQAHKFSEMLNQRSLNSLIPYFSETDFSFDQLKSFCKRLDNQLGEEIMVTGERIIKISDQPLYFKYTRHSTFKKTKRPVVTIFSFRKDNKIFEFSVESQPLEYASPFVGYRTKTDLSLPFSGEWFVAWGGRSYNLNNHAGSRDQRFAYDFVVLKDHTFRKREGKSNKDYFSFGQPILAPGSGFIFYVENTESENKPGEMTNTVGNYIVIDHQNGEYSFLCHLKQGSILVSKGQKVSVGDQIAQCGNSGHSTAPGLHYHLQSTPVLFDGDGLPAQFQNFYVNSQLIERGEPIWSQYISNEK